ncbi:mediator of RNA polymerase II transcription subunit 1-like [Cynara cardunculus var. scolymus]|uniref:mediator of RNA polymerase II transcription subunit 1-like n=1 Tax=Cynara cardunculus var. scolymus TaxID=59895 RepID=UPI000D62F19E|nr:mediator of RNA polymerase II transcription subunit 1-like [Cynara cardunculus var. scolymus]
MAQDEHTSRCSNSSSGGAGGGGGGGGGGAGGSSHRSSKKLKHKKVPQRGMGVAQLEKIISEEQQKKDVSVLTSNSIISPSNSSSNLATTIQKVPNFRPSPISSSSIPLPPPLPPNHHPLISKTDAVNPISASTFSKPASMSSGGGGGVGGSNWCRLWSDGDYSFEGEKQNQSQNHNQNHGLDHPRYTAAFPANLGGLPYESNPPIWPPPPPNLMMQRSQHLQQPCSSSMVNVSSGTSSSSSSSVMNLQMEPPSNQSYCGNNYQPLWSEEEKMVGMKRPYPFSLENVPIPSFHCKFPSAYIPSIPRSDESASCSNGGTVSIESAHPIFREPPLSSGAINDTVTKKFIDENQGLTRDFLKLAPPQPHSSSKEKLHSSPCIGEQTQFETLSPHKGQSKGSTHFSGPGGSNPQPFLSFFPAAKTPMGQPGNSNGEAGESVDLNLKL